MCEGSTAPVKLAVIINFIIGFINQHRFHGLFQLIFTSFIKYNFSIEIVCYYYYIILLLLCTKNSFLTLHWKFFNIII